jgi:hypothetical protein
MAVAARSAAFASSPPGPHKTDGDCWNAKRKGWKSLPDGIEQMLTDWTGNEQNMAGVAIRAFDSNIAVH